MAVKRRRKARPRSTERPGQRADGLRSFAMHAHDRGAKVAAATAEAPPPRGAAAATRLAAAPPEPVAKLGAEAAALAYLERALASDAVGSFTRPVVDGVASEFKSLGADRSPLTGTTLVKFRQMLRQIPVYGSFVTVELDEKNACLGIDSTMGTPEDVDPIARIAPAEALAVAAKASGQAARAIRSTPRLHYYFDSARAKWRLAYIIEDVPRKKGRTVPTHRAAGRDDYVVDARTGALVARLPRAPAAVRRMVTAKDGRGRSRRIAVERTRGRTELRDVALNVATYGFGYRDVETQGRRLPGALVTNPPPFPPAAVAAHANTAAVARFLREVLKRNNIDGRGGAMISTVDCVDSTEPGGPREWQNAAWDGEQMLYGQVVRSDGSLYSTANMLEIVAHEMFHGVTDGTAKIEYLAQPGALAESYSDIFGVLIANRGRPIARFRWQIGVGFYGDGTILRDMQDPARSDGGQPRHMRGYRRARPPYTWERNYNGYVHDNSGIHNYAAYRIMTAKRGGRFLFRPRELAALFFVALTQRLSRTSQFADSRRAVIQTAQTLFRRDPPARRAAKLRAIAAGFAAAGIR
jgi:Zn-dependent metalloprotease